MFQNGKTGKPRTGESQKEKKVFGKRENAEREKLPEENSFPKRENGKTQNGRLPEEKKSFPTRQNGKNTERRGSLAVVRKKFKTAKHKTRVSQ